MELRRRVKVVNRQGLHARPCHSIVTLALNYGCELRISCGSSEVNGKSILELMTLNACQGTELEVCVRGRDGEALLDEIERLFSRGFGEELAS